MHFGFHLANSGPGATPETIRTLGRRAEDLGYDSVWVSDHVVIPMEFTSRYPYPGQFTPQTAGNYFEPVITLAVLAGATQRIQLGTSVLVVPQRNPVLTGKQLGTLAALAGGRLILGVGVGWLQEEFELLGMGAAFPERGTATDESIALYRAIWRDDPVAFQGTHFQLQPFRALPKPPRMPRIWVGGNSRPAIRRAARIGDGWHAIRIGVGDIAAGVEYLREQLRAIGRPPESVTVSLRAHLHLDAAVAQEWELGPTANDAMRQVERYREAGVDAFILSPAAGSSLERTVELAKQFMAEVRPQLVS